jgi:hypothetical protein
VAGLLALGAMPVSGAGGDSGGAAPDAPFTDYRFEAPGTRRRITVDDLPAPYATRPVSNPAQIVARPQGAWPRAPAGFSVGWPGRAARDPDRTER